MRYKFELKWGFLFIVMFLLWMVFEKAMGWHGEKIEDQYIYTNLFAIPAILVYVFAFLDKKKNGHKSMQWKHGFFFGIGMTIVATILSPLSQWIVSELISPEYFPNVIHYVVEHEKMTQEAAEAFFNINNFMIQSTVGTFVMGIITSAIVALFIRKKTPEILG
ncbi:MAG: DUF4199 domain-containing protein [Bacteroidales bacterium]|nr:DUF4199 domain-containing protein [Bacteroidales bacterium]